MTGVMVASFLMNYHNSDYAVGEPACQGPAPKPTTEGVTRVHRPVCPKGAALVARLFKGLLERNVELLLERPARELVCDDVGDVIGIVAERAGTRFGIGARKRGLGGSVL
jgi:hypothetical protein